MGEEIGATETLRNDLQRARQELEQERRKSNGLVQALQREKEQHFNIQQQIEQEEEHIANRLLKRLDQLKQEKQVLATECEIEEEYLVNNLQKRIGTLHQEKTQLEQSLGVLQRKLEELRFEQGKMAHEKEVLENQLEAEQEYIVHKLQKQAAHIAAERQALQLEKTDLKRQVGELTLAVSRLGNEKVALEQSMEMEEEGIVNRLQRVIEGVMARNKVLEACLESHGVNVKDLHPPPVDMSTELCYSIPASRSPMRVDSQMRRNSGDLWSGGSGRSELSTVKGSMLARLQGKMERSSSAGV
ncbi:hypothetical protein CVIRNUC_010748 [Coccomyxa viridis]|uniref:Uncharacterized protein n=1 Tax=Coccomyxa viridis TaxID=1274662 RepID=A0AAV1INA8_9CHLO|nr:hypothetical protein CVIRNUC_010748 [Coccomyxa viridis]